MKIIQTCCSILILFTALTTAASAQTTIKNFDKVDSSGTILRGAQPGTKVAELKKMKVASVLIIKKQTKTEVDEEVEALRDLGIKSKVIPMEWDHADVKKLCHQVVEAVKLLQEAKAKGVKTYFHCTLGQDRTGTVAGLFRMVDQKWTAARAFKEEMCTHGYSDGAPGKPARIVKEIEKSLTPIFLALSKSYSPSTGLNPSACNRITMPASIPTCKKLE